MIGQLNPNGDTWQTFDLWNGSFVDLKSTSNSGQDGTLGGGSTSGGEHGAWVPLGTKLTSGGNYFEFEVHVPPGGRQSGPQWWLRDGDAAVNLSLALDWIDNANGGIDPQSNFHDTTAQPANLFWDTDITAATENIHFAHVVDLDNKHVTYTTTSMSPTRQQVSRNHSMPLTAALIPLTKRMSLTKYTFICQR